MWQCWSDQYELLSALPLDQGACTDTVQFLWPSSNGQVPKQSTSPKILFSVAPELLGQFYTALAALEEKLGDPRNQVFCLFTQSSSGNSLFLQWVPWLRSRLDSLHLWMPTQKRHGHHTHVKKGERDEKHFPFLNVGFSPEQAPIQHLQGWQ